MLGSVPAEQNHASVLAHLGKGARWDIWEQLKYLCQRHQHHCALEARAESNVTVLSHRFKSSFDDELADKDVNAKECLSSFAYGMWYKSVQQCDMLQIMLHIDTNSFNTWPVNESFDDNVHIILSIGERCKYRDRIDVDVQCNHELKVDSRFKLKYWSYRWLTRKQFNIRHLDLMCFPIGNMTQLNIREDFTEQGNGDYEDITDNDMQNCALNAKPRQSSEGQTSITYYATNNI